MDDDAVLAQVLALLRQEKRLSYRVLKLRLQLDDDTLEAFKEDLIYAKRLAVDEEGRVLVWTGDIGEEFVEFGSLLTYGSSMPAFYRRAASSMDQILTEAKPSNFPPGTAEETQGGLRPESRPRLGPDDCPDFCGTRGARDGANYDTPRHSDPVQTAIPPSHAGRRMTLNSLVS